MTVRDLLEEAMKENGEDINVTPYKSHLHSLEIDPAQARYFVATTEVYVYVLVRHGIGGKAVWYSITSYSRPPKWKALLCEEMRRNGETLLDDGIVLNTSQEWLEETCSTEEPDHRIVVWSPTRVYFSSMELEQVENAEYDCHTKSYIHSMPLRPNDIDKTYQFKQKG